VDELPADWYSSDGYATKLLSYLADRSTEEKEKPFFAYLPFSAPHWPLQAPPENIEKYKGLYHDGPDALRLRRLQRLKEMGIIDPSVKPHPVVAAPGEPEEWDSLSDDVRQKSARAMEVYAGMVDRMDWNIGRVVDYLKQSGEYDNTFILFMSDNGAEGASYEAMPLMGQKIADHIAKYYDNSLDNIGRGNSFVWYGSRWAQAATAPSRLYKMFSTEGGCRVPLVVKPPQSGAHEILKNDTTRADRGGLITDAFCTVMDLVPTVLDLAGLSHPGTTYKGREIAPLRGSSWKNFLSALSTQSSDTTRKSAIHKADYVAGFEIAGSGALRRGNSKITFVPAPRGPQRWELFNIADDPGETTDLSKEQPDLFKEMLQLWEDYRKEVGVVGLAGEFQQVIQGKEGTAPQDEFDDPYAWIKYIGRPDKTPKDLLGVVPS
jgi:arylsulfatase A-like enzyme